MTNTTPIATKHRHVWTPVEFGLVIFFVGMLLAMIVPRFLNAENKANDDKTRVNLIITQVALESYAADHNNLYPAAVDDALKSYYPGGMADGKTPVSQGPVNSYTKQPEFPIVAKLPATPVAICSEEPASTGGERGQVVYVPQDDRRTYALLGTTGSGKSIAGILPKTSLVYSNLW